MKHGVQVFIAVPALGEDDVEGLKVRDRVKIGRGLLASIAAVETLRCMKGWWPRVLPNVRAKTTPAGTAASHH